ncbi:MAG: GHKL domain-containing protein [Arenimonas sp.]|nr:GHKL domain-containing protein [Arenimonas sp.]MBP6310068.1 GHKL domain-containing protein [Arenimonas sp.]
MITTRRALSLHARQLIAASLGLIAFLGLTGISLDQAFQSSLVNSLEQRMASYAKVFWNEVEFDSQGLIIGKRIDLPDARLKAYRGGLYAQITGQHNSWQSTKISNSLFSLPKLSIGKLGDSDQFNGPVNLAISEDLSINAYQYTATKELPTENGPQLLSLRIYQDENEIFRQIAEFRRAIWGYLGFAGLLLVLAQIFILRWSLQPLRTLEHDMQALQLGKQPRLVKAYPLELKPIANSINALIDSERSNLELSRNTLADLAHSLKTPLAVLQTQSENITDQQEFMREVETQLLRMNDIVSYQLSRASRAGHTLYSAPIDILPHAEGIVKSLEKIYASKGVYCEFEIDQKSQFSGELGDLQELLGNFLENAFKWANKRVLLTIHPVFVHGAKRPGLFISIEDDGTGIAAEDINKILQRGVRGDERVQGHGIGLAIVQDIISSYHGELQVNRSEELGGARFTINLPCLT